MKALLPIVALFVAVLNGLLLLPAASAYSFPLTVAALILALAATVMAFAGSGAPSAASGPAAPATPPPVAPPPAPAANAAEAELITLLGMFQEKGRLVDFLMEDVTAYDDAQVGAVARVVHQGCREVLKEHFQIAPISDASEGTQVTVPAGYRSDEFRLIGKISGNPPFTGTLVHKGWKTASVKLPRVVKTDAERLPSITPAEVELK